MTWVYISGALVAALLVVVMVRRLVHQFHTPRAP